MVQQRATVLFAFVCLVVMFCSGAFAQTGDEVPCPECPGALPSGEAGSASTTVSTPGFCAFNFIDTNCNGVQDSGEPFAAGWTVCYTGPSGSQCKVSNASGAACWLLLPVGHYTVCVTSQPGWVDTTPVCLEFDILAGQVVQVFFGHKPTPTGACCVPGATCQVLTLAECNAAGGTYLGDGVPCSPEACVPPPPQGACCLPDYSCVVTTEAECGAMGGTYLGDGEPCTPDTCVPPPPQGACCLPDYSCVVTTEAECLESEGTYLGDLSPCDPPELCVPVPTHRESWGRIKNRHRPA